MCGWPDRWHANLNNNSVTLTLGCPGACVPALLLTRRYQRVLKFLSFLVPVNVDNGLMAEVTATPTLLLNGYRLPQLPVSGSKIYA